jgi:hypothetical protein
VAEEEEEEGGTSVATSLARVAGVATTVAGATETKATGALSLCRSSGSDAAEAAEATAAAAAAAAVAAVTVAVAGGGGGGDGNRSSTSATSAQSQRKYMREGEPQPPPSKQQRSTGSTISATSTAHNLSGHSRAHRDIPRTTVDPEQNPDRALSTESCAASAAAREAQAVDRTRRRVPTAALSGHDAGGIARHSRDSLTTREEEAKIPVVSAAFDQQIRVSSDKLVTLRVMQGDIPEQVAYRFARVHGLSRKQTGAIQKAITKRARAGRSAHRPMLQSAGAASTRHNQMLTATSAPATMRPQQQQLRVPSQTQHPHPHPHQQQWLVVQRGDQLRQQAVCCPEYQAAANSAVMVRKPPTPPPPFTPVWSRFMLPSYLRHVSVTTSSSTSSNYMLA